MPSVFQTHPYWRGSRLGLSSQYTETKLFSHCICSNGAWDPVHNLPEYITTTGEREEEEEEEGEEGKEEEKEEGWEKERLMEYFNSNRQTLIFKLVGTCYQHIVNQNGGFKFWSHYFMVKLRW